MMSVAGVALAGDEGGRAQVRAATADAVSNLLEEVSRASLARNLSVGEFLRRTNSSDELVKVLQRAQQVGGPRWIDDHTCQIELQISGPVVAGALNRIAAANPRATPISPRELARVVKEWDERSFSATGAATSRLPAVRVRGSDRIGHPRTGGWQEISQKARDQAVAAAKLDAARRSMSSVRPITLTPRSTVGDALAVKGVGERMQEWYVSQPAARVELTDDMEAVVELEGTPAESFETFHDLALKQKEVAVPADEREWDRVKEDFERRMVTPIGRAVVPMDGPGGEAVMAGPKPLALPGHSPAWARRRLEATGSGKAHSKLMAARDGEAAAEAKLRRQIEELELTPTQTVGQAAKEDPRVERAINRALGRTRIGKADYHADDSAEVSVYLDLGDFWRELREGE